jgi:formate dehydrogenase maturation protein FdhE
MRNVVKGGNRYATCGRCGVQRNIDETRYCTVCKDMTKTALKQFIEERINEEKKKRTCPICKRKFYIGEICCIEIEH